MVAVCKAAWRDILRQDPNVESFMSSAGGCVQRRRPPGRIFVQLKPRKQRELSVGQVIENSCGRRLRGIPGLRVFMTRARRRSASAGASSKSQLRFHAAGPGHGGAVPAGGAVRARRGAPARVAGRHHRPADQEPARERRRSIATARPRCGLNIAQIESALYDAFGPRWASTIYSPTNQYRVLLELLPQYQQHRRPALAALLQVRQRATWCRWTPFAKLTRTPARRPSTTPASCLP